MPSIERLQRVVDILKALPDGRFDLATWRREHAFECGTVACAVGHACMDPELMEQGLDIVDNEPTFEGLTEWNAVEKFFGLSEAQSLRLFYACCYWDTYAAGQGQLSYRTLVIERLTSFINSNLKEQQ